MSSTYGAAVYGTDVYYGGPGQPVVELFLSGVWTDITLYVFVDSGIQIQRGRADEQGAPTPSSCAMVLNNADGRFSPRNASGAYYGSIGRNTQVRVKVYDDAGVPHIRFWGDVAEWPITWDPSGRDVRTSIVCAGLRRQLGLNAQPLTSAYRQGMASVSAVLGYWPMEDGTAATSFGNATSGGPPGLFSGSVALSSSSDFVASAPLPEFSGTYQTYFPVPGYTPDATGQQIRMLLEVDGAGGGWILRVDTSGAHYFACEFAPATDQFALAMYNYATGSQEYASGPVGPWGATAPGRFSLDFRQNGTGVDWTINFLPLGNIDTFFTANIPATTFGQIVSFGTINDLTTATVVMGHVSVENHITSIYDLGTGGAGSAGGAVGAFAGETAEQREARLTTQVGVAYLLGAGPVTSELLGAQVQDTFLNLFDEAAYVEGGLSTEDVETRALVFRKRSSMYSKAPTVALNYNLARFNRLEPTDDDQNTANDVTVVRLGGASARLTQTTGNLSVSSIGDYSVEYNLSLFLDSQTAPQAGFRLALGTVDEARWPVVGFNALTTGFGSGNRDNVFGMREGDTLQMLNVPVYAGGGGTINTIVLGWKETIGVNWWQFEINTRPATPFSGTNGVFILDSATFGVLDQNRLGL